MLVFMSCTTCMPIVHSGQKKIEYPGIGVLDSCEPLFRCWKFNSGPLEKPSPACSDISHSIFTTTSSLCMTCREES